jgi:hypothetical protein
MPLLRVKRHMVAISPCPGLERLSECDQRSEAAGLQSVDGSEEPRDQPPALVTGTLLLQQQGCQMLFEAPDDTEGGVGGKVVSKPGSLFGFEVAPVAAQQRQQSAIPGSGGIELFRRQGSEDCQAGSRGSGRPRCVHWGSTYGRWRGMQRTDPCRLPGPPLPLSKL